MRLPPREGTEQTEEWEMKMGFIVIFLKNQPSNKYVCGRVGGRGWLLAKPGFYYVAQTPPVSIFWVPELQIYTTTSTV